MSNGQARASILVVDDELLMQKSIVRSLHEIYEMTAVGSAEAAVRAIRECKYDLVLCDLVMPGRGGLQLLEELEATKPIMAERTVFMTGDTMDLHAAQVFQIRDRILTKPFGITELEEFVAVSLERQMISCDRRE